MNTIPPLPSIEGDLILDVFTRQYHRSSDSPPDNTEHGGQERLAELGNSVLSMVVMYILFQQRPHLSAADLTNRHKVLLEHENIKQWLTWYNLQSRVRGLEDRAILDEPHEACSLFSSYVGAVYIQKGLPPVLDWIRRLMYPDSESLPVPGTTTTTVTAAAPTPASAALPASPPPYTAPPPPSAAAPALGPPPINALALFNQTCSQRGLVINWESESEGPPHQPRWAVKCYVNNQLRGSGTGRNQKMAREEAARHAFISMGWGSF